MYLFELYLLKQMHEPTRSKRSTFVEVRVYSGVRLYLCRSRIIVYLLSRGHSSEFWPRMYQ